MSAKRNFYPNNSKNNILSQCIPATLIFKHEKSVIYYIHIMCPLYLYLIEINLNYEIINLLGTLLNLNID